MIYFIKNALFYFCVVSDRLLSLLSSIRNVNNSNNNNYYYYGNIITAWSNRFHTVWGWYVTNPVLHFNSKFQTIHNFFIWRVCNLFLHEVYSVVLLNFSSEVKEILFVFNSITFFREAWQRIKTVIKPLRAFFSEIYRFVVKYLLKSTVMLLWRYCCNTLFHNRITSKIIIESILFNKLFLNTKNMNIHYLKNAYVEYWHPRGIVLVGHAFYLRSQKYFKDFGSNSRNN